MDEEIIVESLQMFESVIAQAISSTISNSIVLIHECTTTSLCDALTMENASLHSTRDDCVVASHDVCNDTRDKSPEDRTCIHDRKYVERAVRRNIQAKFSMLR